ncbi:hypothetical protein UFOVP395_75 [uncultured Caudovirales phage]|jgi:hypothetical protein|uniref:Uncharacterized protein n=1 Tax=uncultured Caudovirales phage TaxID=2100421 RepID=A0A6J5M6P4_9CAUD|nr:hypothetical protein UFOVP395_75 [uncultured Caudovirales phage]
MTFVVKSIINNQYKLKVVNQNGSLLQAPATVPVVATAAISDLALYSNTQLMLANDATTYANAVAYAANAVANITVATISDVTLSTVPPANNSTLVYSSANNKYVVKQLDLDGGSF